MPESVFPEQISVSEFNCPDKEGSFSIRKETISGLIFPNEMKFLPFSKADISNEFIIWLPIHSWWFMNFY